MISRCSSEAADRDVLPSWMRIAMQRVTRAFIVWLVALALPLHGFAATTRLLCPHAFDGASAHAHGASAHELRHETDIAADSCASGHEALVADGAQVHKCGTCAACNVGLALPSTMQVMPQAEAAPSTPRPFPIVVHATFLTSGLKHPPRTPLA
jgi:hypothetical protein